MLNSSEKKSHSDSHREIDINLDIIFMFQNFDEERQKRTYPTKHLHSEREE